MSIKYIPTIITVIVAIQGVLRVIISSYSTVILINLILTLICILLIYISRKQLDEELIQKKNIVNYFFFYGLFVLVYSFFVAKSYEQWRYLFTVYFPTLLLPYFIVIASKNSNIKQIFNALVFVAFPLSLILYFSGIEGANDFTRYVSFIYVLLLFVPYVNIGWKIVFISISLISMLYDIDVRGNIMCIVAVYIILLLFYILPKFILSKVYNQLRILLLISPVLFLFLGMFNIVNIFNIGDSFHNTFTVEYSSKRTLLTQDTRTFIYRDALIDIDKKNAYLFGISAAGAHKTMLATLDDDYYEHLKYGRLGSEVGILEYLLRGGLFYVILVFLLYYYSSKLAIQQSKNIFCKCLGVFVIFRWFFLFIESQPVLNLSNLSMFLAIGICLNPVIRNLSDDQMRVYITNLIKL